MGTPAFPNLGKHCTVEDCKQIDFLPFTCDCCHQVFCLEHRSYVKHQCPNGNKNDVTVVICPLCAKGVRLMPDQDPNISWELHVNTDCDPSNYEKATKKRKCPVRGCREILTFSNTIKCRDCTIEHCLKHRFGPDHSCPGPKKPEATAFQFLSFLSRKEEPKLSRAPPTSSSRWSSSLLNAASSFRATAEAGMAKLSSEFSQKLQTARDGTGQSSGGSSGNASRQDEQCPQCNATFSSVTTLVEHVERVHERTGVMKLSIDVCPKCSRGFRDPVALQSQISRFRGEFPVSGMHFQPAKNSFPLQTFATQPVRMGNEAQFQNRPMGSPQLVTADLSRFQVQSPWRGLNPQGQPMQQKRESLPPDLNIGFQPLGSPVGQSSGVPVDSQQPDLALQL